MDSTDDRSAITNVSVGKAIEALREPVLMEDLEDRLINAETGIDELERETQELKGLLEE